MVWGMNHEHVARCVYEKLMKFQHMDFKVTVPGLYVSLKHPFIRVSPDGIASCACHSDMWVVDIKCPYSIRRMDPVQAVEQRLLKYITKEDGKFKLIPGELSGYYEQIQDAWL